MAEKQQGLPEELKKEIEDFFSQNPEQAGIFAARCALRVLPTCVGDDGRPLFSETPEKHFLRYPDEDVQQKYYRLRMLIWLEYLHEQPSSLRCQFLSDWEQGRDFSIDDIEDNYATNEAKNRWNVVAANLPQDIQQTIYREVRCFILPAVTVIRSTMGMPQIAQEGG